MSFLASWHSMYFNTSHVSINPEQAIKDYKAQLNFNTSHVSINLFSVLFCNGVVDFNTSHVSINPTTEACRVRGWENFNTSHVSINRVTGCIWREKYRISIHLMFLLIVKTPPNGGNANSDFNTSHVSINLFIRHSRCRQKFISIHLMFLLIAEDAPQLPVAEEFQYISCFY